MRCQCVYCGIIYDLKEPFEDDSISHGICDECLPGVMNNLKLEIDKIERNSSTHGEQNTID